VSDEGRCELRITRRYDASVEEVWRALTDPDSVARWLAPPPGVQPRTTEGEHVLELEWQPPGEEPSVVRFEVRSEGGRTVLVLDHRQLAATRGMRYMAAWSRVLERFERELA
jgi:uncharacterized protein YndB with AHSA1/START domain